MSPLTVCQKNGKIKSSSANLCEFSRFEQAEGCRGGRETASGGYVPHPCLPEHVASEAAKPVSEGEKVERLTLGVAMDSLGHDLRGALGGLTPRYPVFPSLPQAGSIPSPLNSVNSTCAGCASPVPPRGADCNTVRAATSQPTGTRFGI